MSSDEHSFTSFSSARNKWEQMTSNENRSSLSYSQNFAQINYTPPSKPSSNLAIPGKPLKPTEHPNTELRTLINNSEIISDAPLNKCFSSLSATHSQPDFDESSSVETTINETMAHKPPLHKPRPAVKKKPAHLTGALLTQTSSLDTSARPPSEETTKTFLKPTMESSSELIQNNVTITAPAVVVASPTPTESTFLPPPFRKLSPVVPIVNNKIPAPPPSRPVTPSVSHTSNIAANAFVPPPDPTPAVSLPTLPPRNTAAVAAPISQISTVPSSNFSQSSVLLLNPELPGSNSFAPPPPVPRVVYPQPQAPSISIYNEEHLTVPKSKSPIPPPPPPSRKLNHSTSQQSLNASHRQSPLPSPSDSESSSIFVHHPQPVSSYQKPFTYSLVPSQVSSQVSFRVADSPPDSLQPTLSQQVYQPPPPPKRMDYFANLPNASRSSTFESTSSLNISKRNQQSPSNQEFSSGGEDTGYDSDDVNGVSTSYPDSSQANRRAPIYNGPQHEIPTRHRVEAIAIYGNILIVSSHSTKIIDIQTSEIIWSFTHSDTRFTAIGFKPMSDSNLQGTIAWLGTKDGQLWELDLTQQTITFKRSHMHMVAVTAIEIVNNHIWTISEDGKICVWEDSINATPKAYRMAANFKAYCISGDQIWVGRNRQVHVYHPTIDGTGTFNITPRPIACFPLDVGKIGGDFTCAATVIRNLDNIYFGHEDGSITMFSRSKGIAIESVNISIHKITAMTGVGNNLWVCLKNGLIYVIDVSKKPWKIMKEWKGHEMGVRSIISNERSFFMRSQMGHLPVVSFGQEPGVFLWDGLLKTDWIGMFDNLFQLLISTTLTLFRN